DTYVGCVARDIEPAGDLASKTAADWKSHQDFHEMKKEHERYRQEKYNKVMDGIDQVNAVIDKAALPPETSETGGLIIPEEEKRLEAESQEECGGGVTVPEEETKSESASATEQCFEGDLEVVYVETLTDSEVDYEELEIA
ncbi:MAG: hypothetical protein IM594_04535, partial [Cytophagales bacterium]|nr:hypothetical protein [Cytophagales bacterium]